ncbi:MAG TPA: PEP-CTERM sorting domain-containing protein [Bryobacteraceae bacterium]|nr:PEP-CTERM sorting domain-containing protein [Bryobacteraceae bacterium]
MKLTYIAAGILALSSSLSASTIFFGGGGGDLGVSSKIFTNGSISVTATGFASSGGALVNLFGKGVAGTGAEDGLGLVNDTLDHEIQGNSFIQLDISGLTGVIQIAMGSTGGDSWAIFGSANNGIKGMTQLASGNNDDGVLVTVTNATNFHYLDIAAVTNNVLLQELSNTSRTPEPGTFGLLGLGAIGLGLVRRKIRTRS